MDEQALTLFPYLFPIFFIALWMFVTTVLGVMSGWFRLQQHFPAGTESDLLTLRMRSGRMGFGVNMNSILTLSAGPSGLRVGLPRLFAPFQKPFMVPWEQITAEPRTYFFMPSVRLSFGDPEVGNLTIDARLWQRLAMQSSVPGMAHALPPVSVRRAGYGVLLFWIAITVFSTAFLYVVSRAGGAVRIPLFFSVAFPGILFGIILLVRFLRQVR